MRARRRVSLQSIASLVESAPLNFTKEVVAVRSPSAGCRQPAKRPLVSLSLLNRS